MRLTIIHLWVLACVAYGVTIIMALEGKIEGSIFSTVLFVLLLICTRWVTNDEEVEFQGSSCKEVE